VAEPEVGAKPTRDERESGLHLLATFAEGFPNVGHLLNRDLVSQHRGG
jgi:hypothetical protein